MSDTLKMLLVVELKSPKKGLFKLWSNLVCFSLLEKMFVYFALHFNRYLITIWNVFFSSFKKFSWKSPGSTDHLTNPHQNPLEGLEILSELFMTAYLSTSYSNGKTST